MVSDCILWPGKSFDKDGYGDRGKKRARRDGLSRKAHRAVFQAVFGAIPTGRIVRHSCDNPACINPEHLLLGTQADNMRDAADRDRVHYGEGSPAAKLTVEQVMAIALRRSGGERGVDLAREFGVSPSTICDIHRGRCWRRAVKPYDCPGGWPL